MKNNKIVDTRYSIICAKTEIKGFHQIKDFRHKSIMVFSLDCPASMKILKCVVHEWLVVLNNQKYDIYIFFQSSEKEQTNKKYFKLIYEQNNFRENYLLNSIDIDDKFITAIETFQNIYFLYETTEKEFNYLNRA